MPCETTQPFPLTFIYGVPLKVFSLEPPKIRQILEQSVLRLSNGTTLSTVCNFVKTRSLKCVEQNGRHIKQ